MEQQEELKNNETNANGSRTRKGAGGRCALFAAIAVVWVVIDQLCKAQFADMQPGHLVTEPLPGIFGIRLVHNTGGAWGIFAGSTAALGLLSLVVCAVVVAYFVHAHDRMNLAETVGFSLVVAGGIGNAIDRFTHGFVVDFIEPTFIDFPVFNIADIGVTCGFVLVIIGILVAWNKPAPDDAQGEGADAQANADAQATTAPDSPAATDDPHAGE